MVHRAYCPTTAGAVRGGAAAPSAAVRSPSAVRVRTASAAVEGPAAAAEAGTAPAKVTGWDQARALIIRELQNKNSDVHLLLSGQTSLKVKSKNILDRFAPEHKQESCVNSVSRLLGHFKNKKGPHFSTTKKNNDCKPAWKSKGKPSEAASLLYKLLFRSDKTGMDKMKPEEVYKHHKVFRAYDINDFKKYFKQTVGLVKKHKYVCF